MQLALEFPTQTNFHFRHRLPEVKEPEFLDDITDEEWAIERILEGVLAELPLGCFVFTDSETVLKLWNTEDGEVYQAIGADPHQWQEFIFDGDVWRRGESDISEPRIDDTEWAFVEHLIEQRIELEFRDG